jgi:hypothetical protein
MKDSCTRTGRPRIARDVSSCQMVVILATLYVETYQFDLDPQVAEQKATQILVAFFGIDHAVSKMSAPWTLDEVAERLQQATTDRELDAAVWGGVGEIRSTKSAPEPRCPPASGSLGMIRCTMHLTMSPPIESARGRSGERRSCAGLAWRV